jgi:hypothetical protein
MRGLHSDGLTGYPFSCRWQAQGYLSMVPPAQEFIMLEVCGTVIHSRQCCFYWLWRC